MTNKEINTAIKKELKEAGYSTKDFSVSVKDSLYDTAIKIKIKTPYVSRANVEKILKHWESYELDQRTGEILQGGNKYLFAEYDYKIAELIPEEIKETALKILENRPNGIQVANNETKSLHVFTEGYRTRVIEFSNNSNSQKTIFTYNEIDFVLALFRFYQFGTIAA